MAANGNNGNSTGQSAASAQAAAAGNAAASNAANGNTGTGNTSNTSGTSEGGKGNAGSTNTSTGATNSAGLMGSLMGFANNITGNVGNTYGGGSGGSDNKSDGKKSDGLMSKLTQFWDKVEHAITPETIRVTSRNKLPADVIAKGDEAYTKARAEGKTEAEAQFAARQAVRGEVYSNSWGYNLPMVMIHAFEGKNIGPTYNPSIAAQVNTNKTIAKGSSEMGPSTPAANNAPGGNLGGETGGIVSGAAPTNTGDATNTGITNRGSTVTTPGGTSVTDSGTGGSISSSVTPPSRDASSIGLGVYNTDRANYDQDNWNRGMEVESSSLVSDEECKAFAKRAFMENSEPFKVVRTTILKRC